MGVLERLKSILGLESSQTERGRSPRDRDGTTVTVEHEPSPETEEAVKGVDAETESAPAQQPESEPSKNIAPVTDISGVGPAYAERLADAGIDTVGELAEADAASVASQTELSEKRVARWIEQAGET